MGLKNLLLQMFDHLIYTGIDYKRRLLFHHLLTVKIFYKSL